jgi:hypothetical protein
MATTIEVCPVVVELSVPFQTPAVVAGVPDESPDPGDEVPEPPPQAVSASMTEVMVAAMGAMRFLGVFMSDLRGEKLTNCRSGAGSR